MSTDPETLRESLFAEDREDRVVDERVNPALVALLWDQAELIDSDLSDGTFEYDFRSGFPDRRRLIEWYQRAAVRTLGHISDDWPPQDCVQDPVLIRGLVWAARRGEAKPYRLAVESSVIQPAFNRAYEDLRAVAKEYIQRPDREESDTAPNRDLDPASQKSPAMRPGFRVLDKQQQQALKDLWGGFGDEDELVDWLHSLNAPTNGEIDSDLTSKIIGDGYAMKRLVHDPDTAEARRFREAFAASVLLPDFVSAVEIMDAEELAETVSGRPTTLRMKGGGGRV